MESDGIGSLLEEVVRRANRLSEWAQLEPYLRKVQESFRAFMDLLRSNLSEDRRQFKNPVAAVASLQIDWNDKHFPVLDELSAFGKQLIWIHKPLQDGTKTDGKESIQLILDAGEGVDKILIEVVSAVQLYEASRAFQRTVNTHMANHQIRFRKEVGELCEFTNRLRSLLHQRLTPPPAAAATETTN